MKIKDIKVLVARCSKLEDLFLDIHCCTDDICHHFDEVISIIVGSPLSDTLVNLSLKMAWYNVHNEKFRAKCLELGQMKKLKKVEITAVEEVNGEEILRKHLPHLTIAENREQENLVLPAHPYAKHNKSSGFWEISCNPLSCNF